MKIDVGQSILLKHKTAITIQSNYPGPLIAQDGMSQSYNLSLIVFCFSFSPSHFLDGGMLRVFGVVADISQRCGDVHGYC